MNIPHALLPFVLLGAVVCFTVSFACYVSDRDYSDGKIGAAPLTWGTVGAVLAAVWSYLFWHGAAS